MYVLAVARGWAEIELTRYLVSQLPEYHLYRFCGDSRYRLPTPPPDDFGDDVGFNLRCN